MQDTVLVPIQLQAFVLNPDVCEAGAGDYGEARARIIPISQPNYSFLRLDNFSAQADVLKHVDLHGTYPAEMNSRVTDTGDPSRAPRRSRHGVYLHWILPRVYRTGTAAADPEPDGTEASTTSVPHFHQPPDRWLVFRKVDLESIDPQDREAGFDDRYEWQGWVIDSNYCWTPDNEVPRDYDLEVDVSPFVVGASRAGAAKDTCIQHVDVNRQGEVFIGRKTPLETWTKPSDAHLVDFGVLRSGNELFADFQMHNGNVFSMLDNFAYQGTNGEEKYLTRANASYCVMGWHTQEEKDPLWFSQGSGMSISKALKAAFMEMQTGAADAELPPQGPVRVLCRGAMYEVEWDHHSRPKVVPADGYAQRIQDPDLATIAVGPSPVEALLAYCVAHKDKDAGMAGTVEQDLVAIESLLNARDDGVEARREAGDSVFNQTLPRSTGGTRFFLPDETGPDGHSGSVQALQEANRLQQLLDGCGRLAKQRRWDMFALWWRYVSDVENRLSNPAHSVFQARAQALESCIEAIQGQMNSLKTLIDDLLRHRLPKGVKRGTQPFFHRGRDPTVLVGGVASGWPSDFSKPLTVRTPNQALDMPQGLYQEKQPTWIHKGFNALWSLISSLPNYACTDINMSPAAAIAKTIEEFFILDPTLASDFWTQFYPPAAFPQFHTSDEASRDRWNKTQPWFPLFVEWEVEYFHIPFDQWTLTEGFSRASETSRLKYEIDKTDGEPLWQMYSASDHDTRILSGRNLLLPQPNTALAIKLKQLFSQTPAHELEKHLSKSQQEELLSHIADLAYLSFPMAGLSDGLVTLQRGTHVRPENKEVTAEGEQVRVLQQALFAEAGLTEDRLKLIAGHSALTPYGASSYTDTKYSPFKPVTHGQMRFKKLNVIDKFGQAISAIDPDPTPDGPPPLHPCVSDAYAPQPVEREDGDSTIKTANTILQNLQGHCEFIQLPPQINQDARLNLEFVIPASPVDHPASWTPATEWDNPIWGWVVVNFADQGIQLFLADGTFYTEVRITSHGAPESVRWSPFKPAKSREPDVATARLEALVDQLHDESYAKGFWAMITTAMESLPPTSTAHAQFPSSVVGRPFALVNIGLSLELAGPPLVDQTVPIEPPSTPSSEAPADTQSPEPLPLQKSQSQAPPPADSPAMPDVFQSFGQMILGNYMYAGYLPRPESPHQAAGPPPHEPRPEPHLLDYEFQVKLGGKDRHFDGLIGYLDAAPPATDGRAAPQGHEFRLDSIHTYFSPLDENGDAMFDNLHPLGPNQYPRLHPFYVSPVSDEAPYTPLTPEEYSTQRNAHLHVFAAIVDPFTPMHVYASFLPSEELALPSWTWHEALNNMMAFVHAGPMTLTKDVDKYHATEILTETAARQAPTRNVALPALLSGEWNWLQPYVDDASAEGDAAPPVYNAFGFEKKGDLLVPGFEKGPYTAVEGFLQLRRPLMATNQGDKGESRGGAALG